MDDLSIALTVIMFIVFGVVIGLGLGIYFERETQEEKKLMDFMNQEDKKLMDFMNCEELKSFVIEKLYETKFTKEYLTRCS